MIYIGIDPGLHGAIATIRESESESGAIDSSTIPTIMTGKKRVLNHAMLSSMFALLQSTNQIFDGIVECYAVLERQHAMPKQGVVSTLSIGYGFGALKQCLVDFTIPHEVVHANVWQKEFSISARKGNTKAQALQICQDLFPDVNLLATEKSKKPHDGIVDALLIAEYARRRHSGIASQSDRETLKEKWKKK